MLVKIDPSAHSREAMIRSMICTITPDDVSAFNVGVQFLPAVTGHFPAGLKLRVTAASSTTRLSEGYTNVIPNF